MTDVQAQPREGWLGCLRTRDNRVARHGLSPQGTEAILEGACYLVWLPYTKTEKKALRVACNRRRHNVVSRRMSNFAVWHGCRRLLRGMSISGILSDLLPVITTPGGLQNNLSNFNASQGGHWSV